MKRTSLSILLSLLSLASVLTSIDSASGGQKKSGRKKREPKPNPAFATLTDDPALPRVLLIGDSISIGYTLPAREMLQGKANVHRIPTNAGPTIRGLKNIDNWLGQNQWDLIHFNWGLHDLKRIDGKHQVPLDQYEQNLRKLTARLKRTGAKLVWCNTTPVPQNVKPPRTNDDVIAYNKAAAGVMQDFQIPTDDLYTFAHQRLTEIQRPNNVHFTPTGSKALAGQVAKTIRQALELE